MSDELVIGGKSFNSRLIVGTGRYRTMEEMVAAVEASGTEMITVAIRRLNLDDPTSKTLLDYIDWNKYQICPLYTSPSPRDQRGARMPASA